ncbi:MAG: response regulator transcription factor [Chitinophagaceae bacterium]|nr:response regulator transcription factor [Chitinophagaceae bacterium]
MDKELSLTKIALADDHVLLRNALATLINSFENCKVIIEASTGKELIKTIGEGSVPDIILLDLNMPELDGYDTALWMQCHLPQVHVLMLTMYDSELTMIRLLQVGVKGFLKKDIHPAELKFAISSVMQCGYYYTNDTTGKLVNLFRKSQEQSTLMRSMLTETEVRFLRLTCTEMTYKEIAVNMHLNPRAIDNLRDNLFNKLDVKSRVGLAMYAIKHGIYTF